MAEPLIKKLNVTFQQSLPMGTRGTFTYEKQLWIAYPGEKNQRLFAVTDRLIGIHRAIEKDMIGWLNRRPGDAELVTGVLERVALAQMVHTELVAEKTEARVM